MKLLVTGGTGLIGSAIENVDIRLGSKDADLKSWEQTNKIFKSSKPTHVIHCAARVGGLGGNISAKGEYYYDNIMMNTNVKLVQMYLNIKIYITCILFTDRA